MYFNVFFFINKSAFVGEKTLLISECTVQQFNLLKAAYAMVNLDLIPCLKLASYVIKKSK